MLKKIPEILPPNLLKVLAEMGHGDEIVISDGNYPAASNARNLIRCDGLGVSALLESILELCPLDKTVESPVSLMAVAEDDTYNPVIWNEFVEILENSKEENINIEYLDRFDFYRKGKEAYAIIATSEKALYANVILKKGVDRKSTRLNSSHV